MKPLGVAFLEALLESEYNLKNYNLIEDNNWETADNLIFTVTNAELDGYQQDYVRNIEATQSTKHILGYVLNDLCLRGKLRPGKYFLYSDSVKYPEIKCDLRVMVREIEGEQEYSSYDVYYGRNEEIESYIGVPIAVYGETYEEFLLKTLRMLEKPPIIQEGLVESIDPGMKQFYADISYIINKFGFEKHNL